MPGDLTHFLYRKEPLTTGDYADAIHELRQAILQLEPDGANCRICGSDEHQAFECRFNVLVMARRAAAMAGLDASAIPWRCYHCGAIFYDSESAQEHFGDTEKETVKCRRETTPC